MIEIRGKQFHVVADRQKDGHTLCIAAQPWEHRSWGVGRNGKCVLDLFDNSKIPFHNTAAGEWYFSLSDDERASILPVNVTTNGQNTDGEGSFPNTQIFVPSLNEWLGLDREIRELMTKNEYAWTRCYAGYDKSSNVYRAFAFHNGYSTKHDVECKASIFPAFYLNNEFLKGLDDVPMEISKDNDQKISTADVVAFLKEMQVATAKCNGFFAGHVTQIWVINELLGNKIKELGGNPYLVKDGKMVVEE